MVQAKSQIIIIGGGAWGAAIAATLSAADALSVMCLVRDEATAIALGKGRVPRLDDMPLANKVAATTNPDCLSGAQAIYLVLPAAATAEAIAMIDRYAPADCPVILCAKGLVDTDEQAGLLLPEFMALKAPERPFAILSGPSFADEVIKGLPCALVASSDRPALSEMIVSHFAHSLVRLYAGDDPIGVAVGGAVKNVIALAAGITAGLDLGDNARAALITRGLAETGRLITALGGKPETLSGLAGIGDLTLTASGPHSRNMAYGLALGKGEALPSALAEGARTAPLLDARAKRLGLEMPITSAVSQALMGANLHHLLSDLLARPPARE